MTLPDTLSPREIPRRANMALLVALTLMQVGVLLAPMWLPLHSASAVLAVLAIFSLTCYTYWALIHEAIHGLFSMDARINRLAGRCMSIVHGCPFAVLRVAHLLHHKYNRVEDFAETYDAGTTRWWAAAVRYYLILLFGRYLSEVMVNGIVWLPASIRQRIIPRLVSGEKTGRQIVATLENASTLAQARWDAMLCLTLFAASAWAYASAVGTFVLVQVVRALVISVFDDAYHYGTARNYPEHPEPARNHRLPGSWLILHFNLHGVHHRYPTASWITLPRLAARDGVKFEGGYFRSALRQLRGPIREQDLPANTN